MVIPSKETPEPSDEAQKLLTEASPYFNLCYADLLPLAQRGTHTVNSSLFVVVLF